MNVTLDINFQRFIKLVDLDFCSPDNDSAVSDAGWVADAAMELFTDFETQNRDLPLRVLTYEQMTLALRKVANYMKGKELSLGFSHVQPKVVRALQKAEAERASSTALQITQWLPTLMASTSVWAKDCVSSLTPMAIPDGVIRHRFDRSYFPRERMQTIESYQALFDEDLALNSYTYRNLDDRARSVLSFNDTNLAEPVVQQKGINGKFEGEKTFLHLAVEANRPNFVQWLLSLNIDATAKDKEGYTAYDRARQNCNLSLCKLFRGPAIFGEVAREALAADLERILLKVLLNCDPKDLLAFITAIKELKNEECNEPIARFEAFMKTGGTLIARSQSQREQVESYKLYGIPYGRKSYEEQQRLFGMERFQIYTGALNGVLKENWSLDQVLKHLATSRPKIQPSPLERDGRDDLTGKHFAEFRDDNLRHFMRTFFLNGCRYESYLQLSKQTLASLYKQYKQNPAQVDSTAILDRRSFWLTYTDDNGKEIYLACNDPYGDRPPEEYQGKWLHTHAENAVKLRPILATLFEEIKTVAKTKQISLEQLKRKIAFFYWLSCNAVLICRGNSQYCLETHKLAWEINGYAAIPLAHRYSLPDCVTLCLPFQQFYDNYYNDLFEITPRV